MIASFPSISVVIPAYNRAKTIRRCLDSVVAQTVSPLETIVVDDCSTDETKQIVMNYDNKNVRYIALEKHSGAQTARNRGILEAKGTWIAFQDSDDEWFPKKLEKQLQTLKNVDFDLWTVVHTNAEYFDAATGCRTTCEMAIIHGDKVYSSLLSTNGPFFPTFLVSKTALIEIGYLDEKVPSFQEWDTAIRLAKKCRFIHLREPLFVYNVNGASAMSRDKSLDITGYQYIIDKHEKEIRKVCGDAAWERHLFVQLEKCLNSKLWSEADTYLTRIETRPFRYRIFQALRCMYITPKLLRRFDLLSNG